MVTAAAVEAQSSGEAVRVSGTAAHRAITAGEF